MPVYVYRNLRTGETFEVEQRITESAWTEHPESGDPVKRLVQPVGIAFKGSGFYVNDSRGASKSSANGAAPPADGKGSDGKGSDAKGSDAKAAGATASDGKAPGGTSSGAKSTGSSSGS